MNITTVYVGMDVHKDSFSLCCFTLNKERPEVQHRTQAGSRYVLKYLEAARERYGNEARFLCGYEAGCTGFTLYHELKEHNVSCVVLAPTTMSRKAKGIKTDRRDAEQIARCLALHDYSPVHVPTKEDEQVS